MKKITKLLFVAALMALLCLALTGCGRTKVDVSQYLSVKYVGSNGYATAYVSLDKSELEGSVMGDGNDMDSWVKLSEMSALAYTMKLEPEKVENVKNGDKITVRVTVDEDMAKEAGYKFTGLKKTFTVEGLQDAVVLDPFAEDIFGMGKTVDVQLSGVSPDGELSINNNAAYDDPVSLIRYKVDNSWNLKYGDVVTVTASLSGHADEYVLSRTEAALTLTGFDRYVTDPSQLPTEVLQAMADRVCQEALANGESDILDGVNDTWLSGNVTYDNVRVGDTAMVGVVLDPDSVDGWSNTTYNFVLLPVYRNVTTDSYYDEAQGMTVTKTWENVINHYLFQNVVVHSDGSVTYDDSYLAHRGFFTDESAAGVLSLDVLRQNYELIEFNMP